MAKELSIDEINASVHNLGERILWERLAIPPSHARPVVTGTNAQRQESIHAEINSLRLRQQAMYEQKRAWLATHPHERPSS